MSVKFCLSYDHYNHDFTFFFLKKKIQRKSYNVADKTYIYVEKCYQTYGYITFYGMTLSTEKQQLHMIRNDYFQDTNQNIFCVYFKEQINLNSNALAFVAQRLIE